MGTLREAKGRDLNECALVVQQFRPDRPIPGDTRNWPACLERNAEQFDRFAAAFGGISFATDFIPAGLKLHVIKLESAFSATP